MDFSSIMNDSGYKYIESPVIYKFPSDRFIVNNGDSNNNNMNGSGISGSNRPSVGSNFNINKISNMLFRRENHQQLDKGEQEGKGISGSNGNNYGNENNYVYGNNNYVDRNNNGNAMNNNTNNLNYNNNLNDTEL